MVEERDIERGLEYSVEQARKTMTAGKGGPFGAAVLDENGVVLAVGSNRVLADNDPTAHAEIVAIRRACKVRGSYDLSSCTLIATGEPCPMCLSAIIWANIKTVYFNDDVKAAEEVGFRDDHIYKFIRGGNSDKTVLDISQLDAKFRKLSLYPEYTEIEHTIY